MGAIADERNTIAGKLAAAGVLNTLDPRTVPPCVLIGEPYGVSAVGVGGWRILYPIHVMSPVPADADSLAWRLEQVETIIVTLGFAPFTSGTYGPKDNPAYELVYSRDVANPNC